MVKIGFENLKEMKIEDIRKIEKIYTKIPEGRFKMVSKKKKKKSAQQIINELP